MKIDRSNLKPDKAGAHIEKYSTPVQEKEWNLKTQENKI
jgi:MFS family permease